MKRTIACLLLSASLYAIPPSKLLLRIAEAAALGTATADALKTSGYAGHTASVYATYAPGTPNQNSSHNAQPTSASWTGKLPRSGVWPNSGCPMLTAGCAIERNFLLDGGIVGAAHFGAASPRYRLIFTALLAGLSVRNGIDIARYSRNNERTFLLGHLNPANGTPTTVSFSW